MPKEHVFWASRFLEVVDGTLLWKLRGRQFQNSYEADSLFNSKYAGMPAGGRSGLVKIMGYPYETKTIIENL